MLPRFNLFLDSAALLNSIWQQRLTEVFDEHDIALDLLHAAVEDPVLIGRNAEHPSGGRFRAQIHFSDFSCTTGREIKEFYSSGTLSTVQESDPFFQYCPRVVTRHPVKDAKRLSSLHRHPPNGAVLCPMVKSLPVQRFVGNESAVLCDLNC